MHCVFCAAQNTNRVSNKEHPVMRGANMTFGCHGRELSKASHIMMVDIIAFFPVTEYHSDVRRCMCGA